MNNMSYKAIFFDMDGTLVPMNMQEFLNGYFKLLAVKLARFEIPTDKLVAAVWAGTADMVSNDGSVSNERRFWDKFVKETGVKEEEAKPLCDDFYSNEFRQAKAFTQENTFAKEAVSLAKSKAEFVALTTNPLFPMNGQETRMNYVGLTASDFDLVTSYESDGFCKPNPQYFVTVCDRLGVKPSECLMIGNDEKEDMWCASQLGMDAYLVTDTVIRSKDHPWNGPSGTFQEMVEMLRSL